MCVSWHQRFVSKSVSTTFFLTLFILSVPFSLFSVFNRPYSHFPPLIPFILYLLLLFHPSLFPSSSLAPVNTLWQGAHSRHAIRTVQRLSVPCLHPVGVFLSVQWDGEDAAHSMFPSLASSFISQHVDHVYLQQSCKEVLLFVVCSPAEPEKLRACPKLVLFSYSSWLDGFFYFTVFDVLS